MRNYKRKTDRGQTPVQQIEAATREVLEQGRSLGIVAAEYEARFNSN